MDEGIRPLAGAFVRVVGTPENATTGLDGGFRLRSLPPAVYFLVVSKAGYVTAHESVEVPVQGRVSMRFVLGVDTSATPYHATEVDFKGHMEVWAGLAQSPGEEAANGTALCKCSTWFTPAPGLRTLVFQAAWTESAPHPNGPSPFYYQLSDPRGSFYHDGYCTSPCRDAFDPRTTGYEEGHAIRVRFEGPDNNPALDQDFELFVTAFYWQWAPGAWSLGEP